MSNLVYHSVEFKNDAAKVRELLSFLNGQHSPFDLNVITPTEPSENTRNVWFDGNKVFFVTSNKSPITAFEELAKVTKLHFKVLAYEESQKFCYEKEFKDGGLILGDNSTKNMDKIYSTVFDKNQEKWDSFYEPYMIVEESKKSLVEKIKGFLSKVFK